MNMNIPGASIPFSIMLMLHFFSWTLLLGPRIRKSGGGVSNGALPFGFYC